MRVGGRRRFGRVVLAVSEVVLALSGLVTLWMLTDISRGVANGAYSQAAASGFAVAFRGLWGLSFVVLTIVLLIDASIWLFRAVDDDIDAVCERAPRIALELAIAALIAVFLLNVGPASTEFDLLLAATAMVGFWVVVHHAVGAVRSIRGAVMAG